MKKKNIIKISAIVFSIIIVIVAITTTTQSYFNKDNYAKNPTEYQTGLLSIEAASKSNNISLSNTLPMSDTEGEQTDPYVFTIKNNGNVDYKFSVKLLSTSDNTFSPEYIKIKIDDEEVKTLSSLTDSIIKKDIILPAGETIDITLRVWLNSNTPNTQIGKTFNSKIVIDGQSIYTSTNQEADSSLKDFIYYLGSEYSRVNTLYNYDYNGTIADYEITSIPLASNEILLVKYIGNSKNVVIPDTYMVNDTIYNVVIASEIYLINFDDVSGIFQGNTNIESVHLDDNIKVIDSDDTGYYENNAWGLFLGCTSLVTVSKIPSSVTSMGSTFYGCTSLVNAPEIPSSVTNMSGTFQNCTNLTGNVRVNSSNVSNVTNIFTGTTKNITVQVPSGSTTYTKINNLTTSNGKPSNVTLTTY